MKKTKTKQAAGKKSRNGSGRNVHLVARNMPYFFFLLFLTMLYIGNAQHVEKKVREIDEMRGELKELNWIYMSLKSDVIYEGTYSRIVNKVDQYQLSNQGAIPQKLPNVEQ